MNAITVDMSEVNKLAADFGKIPGRFVPEGDAITKKAAQNIKDQMVADAESSGHYKFFAGSITYDRAFGFGEIGYEIGPDKDRRQGALGNVLYFGTSKNGPVLDLDGPLKAEAPRFEKAIGDLAVRIVAGR